MKAEVVTVKPNVTVLDQLQRLVGLTVEESQTDLYDEDTRLDTIWQTCTSSHIHGSIKCVY